MSTIVKTLHKNGLELKDRISVLEGENIELRKEVLRLRQALETAIYDLERIRDSNWDALQMRLGARSGAFLAKKALI